MLIRARVHPFPSRTRKLSSLLPTILGWRRPGKIGSANIEKTPNRVSFFFAQLWFARIAWDGWPSRDRSVKFASAHDTWRADAPGIIGSANIEKAPNRVSLLIAQIWFAKKDRDGWPSRDRSVKLASAHDTWRGDAPGKIGSANIGKAHNRVSFLFACIWLRNEKTFSTRRVAVNRRRLSYFGYNLKAILHILREQSCRLVHSSRLFWTYMVYLALESKWQCELMMSRRVIWWNLSHDSEKVQGNPFSTTGKLWCLWINFPFRIASSCQSFCSRLIPNGSIWR